MARMFQRAWKIIVDDLEVSALDCRFRAEKNTKGAPNKLKLEIINLSLDHAAQIAKRAQKNKATGVQVEVHAGYVEDMPLIFRGDAHKITPSLEATERVATIMALDGGRTYREAHIELAAGPGTLVRDLLKKCALAMGIGPGNVNEVAADVTMRGVGRTLPVGTVLSGKAANELTRITRSVGLTWSIQNGVLQLQIEGKPLNTESLRISADSGLVGSPTTDMDATVASTKPKKEKPTHVLITTLMIPGISPGRVVVLDSPNYKGGYQIVQCDYSGDTSGQDWYIKSKLSPY